MVFILAALSLLSSTPSFGKTVEDEELFALLRTCQVGTYQNRNKSIEVVGTMGGKCKVIFGKKITCLIDDQLKNTLATPHKKLGLLEKSTILGNVFSSCDLSLKPKPQPKELLPFCDEAGKDVATCRKRYVPGFSLDERRKSAQKSLKNKPISELEKEQKNLRIKCFDGSDQDSCILYNVYRKALSEREKK